MLVGLSKRAMQVMDRAEVMRWRKAERKKLIGERLATPSDTRRRHADKIVASLEVSSPKPRGSLSAPTGLFVVSRTYGTLWLAFRTAADDVPSLWS